jgi:hypothetical protein
MQQGSGEGARLIGNEAASRAATRNRHCGSGYRSAARILNGSADCPGGSALGEGGRDSAESERDEKKEETWRKAFHVALPEALEVSEKARVMLSIETGADATNQLFQRNNKRSMASVDE